ncbi:MAG: hypothetical protein ACO1SX_04170 [Actinomycetota bacterium]
MTGLTALRGMVTAAASGSSFQDTFNRADQEGLGSSSDGSKTWVIDPPLETSYAPGYALGWEVKDNRAGINFLSGSLQGAYVTDLPTAGRAKIVLGELPPANIPFYILGRVQDQNNHLRVQFNIGSPTTVLAQKVIGGAVDTVGMLTSTSMSAGDSLELEITSDNDIRVYRNGLQVGFTANDDAHSSQGGWGMAVYGENGVLLPWGGSIDQFEFMPG